MLAILQTLGDKLRRKEESLELMDQKFFLSKKVLILETKVGLPVITYAPRGRGGGGV